MNALIEKLVVVFFPSCQSEIVRNFILKCSSFDIYPNKIQIWASILILSKSSIEEFESVLSHAKKDWRDVVVAAGLAVDDWEVICNKVIKY
jgi:hypothetical protein